MGQVSLQAMTNSFLSAGASSEAPRPQLLVPPYIMVWAALRFRGRKSLDPSRIACLEKAAQSGAQRREDSVVQREE